MPPIAAGIIIMWSGTQSSIPGGWARETALDGRYPKGAPVATDPGGTGGALTHSHTTTTHVHTAAHTHTVPDTTGSAGASVRDTGTTNPPAVHTHASNPATTDPAASLTTEAPSSDSINHEPAFATVIFLRSDGTPIGFPVNGVGIWHYTAAAPGSWALCDGGGGRPDLRNRFLKGAATSGDAGGTGGGATHTHTIASHTHSTPFAHTHPNVTSAPRAEALVAGDISGTTAGVATATHTHDLTIASTSPAITGTADTAQSTNHEPPAWVLAYVQNISGALSLPNRIIALWLGTLASIPSNWALCDGSNSTPDLRSLFLKGATTVGGSGTGLGSLTHGHTATGHTHAVAAHTHPVSGAAGAGENRTDGATNAPTTAHTHTWPDTGSASFTSGPTAPTVAAYTDTQPPYTHVAFLQWQPTGWLDDRYYFKGATTVTIPGATHGRGTANLLVEVVDDQFVGRHVTPQSVTVDTSSFDVVVTFAQAQSGAVLIAGRPVTPYAQPFTGQTTVTIAGASHGLGTSNLVVRVYDAAAIPAQVRPSSVSVDIATYDVVVIFGQPQSGTIVLMDATAVGPPYNVGSPFAGVSTVPIAGSAHALGTPNLLVQVYDNGSPVRRQLTPQGVTVDPSSFNVVVTFGQPQSGAVILSGAGAPPQQNIFRYGVAVARASTF
jgi:hypothetical protein